MENKKMLTPWLKRCRVASPLGSLVLICLALWGMPEQASADAQVYYIHADHVGTPQILTDEDQRVAWRADYAPFGEATVTTATIDNPLRFPGQYHDAETGLHYNYFRDYDPSTGRYMESDPIGLEGGLNAYSYALNNPQRYTDPFGLDSLLPPKCPLGQVVRWASHRGFYCELDPDPKPERFCLYGECAVYPPETNCSCTQDCHRTVTAGGVWGSLTVGAICAKATRVPIAGVACNSAVWMACGAACQDECQDPCK